MKTKLLAQTGWRGQLNDRVLSPAFRTLEDAHSLPLIPIAVLSTFDGRLLFSPLPAAALAQPRTITMPLSMVMTLVGDLLQCLCSVSRADGLPGSCIKVFCCFLVVQTLWAKKFSQQPMPDR